ncbi:hypothetical protein LTR62_003352 [Meristemomyces frigidus]|uniref:Uncharacterized protein n=1 Tax=Meristemomyces frigidus TaxID=1508187 RepID=A0AAN7TJB1_9PEZI|nr:hypothetical protein LTR62_003352 [Meristemomyces frigidus]
MHNAAGARRQLSAPATTFWLTPGRRSYTGQTNNEPITPREQPLTVDKDAFHSARERRHGGRSLPLPPVMDPTAAEARTRFTKSKPWKLEGEKSEFQTQMQLNSFAQALASPIRQCHLTNARLPSHFLLPIVGSTSPLQDDQMSAKANLVATVGILGLDTGEQRSRTRSYILAQHHVLDFISARKKWGQLIHEHLRRWFVARTAKSLEHARDFQKQIAWNANTANAVLDKLRKDVIERFRKDLVHHHVVRMSAADEYNDVAGADVACILHIDSAPDPGLSSKLHRKDVTTYNMSRLLGDDLGKLLDYENNSDDTERANKKFWFIVKRSRHSMQLQLMLMKLGNYKGGSPAT